MRPGRHPWAENDLYVAGPDIGSDSKTQPLALHQDDGYYRERRPAPDILNWQLNRSALTHQFMAKMFAANWTLPNTSAYGAATYTLHATNHIQDANNSNISAFFYDTAAGGTITEVYGTGGDFFVASAASPVVAGILGVSTMDSDGDDATRRVLVAQATPTDRVWYAVGYGAGAWNLAALGGAAKHWLSVGCDRNTAGGATPLWLIGDSGNGGGIAPVLYSSADGINFANVGGYPGLAIGQQNRGIFHTCHPAGALGPDDTGNPSWLILTDARALVSADGATWSDQAHGFGGAAPHDKSAAYSRTSRRWVVPLSTGAIEYSDDNGVTWTTVAGALSGIGGNFPQIKCDGYGTFVVSENSPTRRSVWISTDEGMNWTRISMPYTTGFDEVELEVGMSESNNWNDPGAFPTYFTLLAYDKTAPLLEAFRSLVY